MISILIPAIKSHTVTNEYANENSNKEILTVGFNGKHNYCSYLFFDTSLIPCNSIISKAELVLFKADKFYNDTTKKIYISPLKDYFSTYTTYEKSPIYDSYTTTSFYPLTSKVSISINLTKIISSWVINPQSNKGIILYDKVKNGLVNFTSVKSDDKPFIRVIYTLPTNKFPKEKSDCNNEGLFPVRCKCNHNCGCNKDYYCSNNCCCDRTCVNICKDELRAIITEACKEGCCKPTPPVPQPDSTLRQVNVTGTVEPLSVYFIVINIEVTRAGSGLKDNYYLSDEYDNSLNNNSLSIDKIYNIAIIPNIQPGDTEKLTLYGSYKGPILI